MGLESMRIPRRLARMTPQRLCRADKEDSELLGRLDQTEDRIPLILIEKADHSPRTALCEVAFDRAGRTRTSPRRGVAIKHGRDS